MSCDLSDHPELQALSSTLRVLDQILVRHQVPWFLIGATARDLVGLCYEMTPGRLTRDIDLAVAIPQWETFDRIGDEIVASRNFSKDSSMTHRFRGNGVVVDIVPFGGVAEAGQIRWPPEYATVMSILGFEEALADAESLLLPGNFGIRVASPAGLLLLKLVAWNDRHQERPHHDAEDISYLLKIYTSSRGIDTLFSDGLAYVERFDFDVDLASAALIGFRAGRLAKSGVSQLVQTILDREIDVDGPLSLATDLALRSMEVSVRLLKAVRVGFREGSLHDA